MKLARNKKQEDDVLLLEGPARRLAMMSSWSVHVHTVDPAAPGDPAVPVTPGIPDALD